MYVWGGGSWYEREVSPAVHHQPYAHPHMPTTPATLLPLTPVPGKRRADGRGPYSWTPVHGGPTPVGDGYAASVVRADLPGPEYTFRYVLPAGVSCTRCVLQVGGWLGRGMRAGCKGRRGLACQWPALMWRGALVCSRPAAAVAVVVVHGQLVPGARRSCLRRQRQYGLLRHQLVLGGRYTLRDARGVPQLCW